jgi:hypothetical protein
MDVQQIRQISEGSVDGGGSGGKRFCSSSAGSSESSSSSSGFSDSGLSGSRSFLSLGTRLGRDARGASEDKAPSDRSEFLASRGRSVVDEDCSDEDAGESPTEDSSDSEFSEYGADSSLSEDEEDSSGQKVSSISPEGLQKEKVKDEASSSSSSSSSLKSPSDTEIQIALQALQAYGRKVREAENKKSKSGVQETCVVDPSGVQSSFRSYAHVPFGCLQSGQFPVTLFQRLCGLSSECPVGAATARLVSDVRPYGKSA